MTLSPISYHTVCRELVLTTSGVAPGGAGDWLTIDMDVPTFRNAGQQAQAMFAIGLIELVADDQVEVSVSLISGTDRQHEAPPVNLLATNFSKAMPKRSTDHTTTAAYMLESRLQLSWRNFAGAGARTFRFTCVVGVRRYGT